MCVEELVNPLTRFDGEVRGSFRGPCLFGGLIVTNVDIKEEYVALARKRLAMVPATSKLG